MEYPSLCLLMNREQFPRPREVRLAVIWWEESGAISIRGTFLSLEKRYLGIIYPLRWIYYRRAAKWHVGWFCGWIGCAEQSEPGVQNLFMDKMSF